MAASGLRAVTKELYDGTVRDVQTRLDTGWRKLVPWTRRLAKRDRGVVIVKRDKDTLGLRPLSHFPLARVSPGNDFDPPSSAMHPFQRAVKPASFNVAGSVPGQQRDNARITVVVPTILKHSQLQPLVRRPLLTSVWSTPIKEIHFYARILHAVPELLHLRRNGTGRNCLFQRSIRVCQTKQIVKVDAQQIPRAWSTLLLFGNALRLMIDVGIVPVDEYSSHH